MDCLLEEDFEVDILSEFRYTMVGVIPGLGRSCGSSRPGTSISLEVSGFGFGRTGDRMAVGTVGDGIVLGIIISGCF